MLNAPGSFCLLLPALLFSSCMSPHLSPLADAAGRGDISGLEMILKSNPSPEERSGALVAAARNGQPEAIRILVRAGADPNARSGVNGWPVLMHAIHKDQPRAVGTLLDLGADVNAGGPGGETPLMMAAGYGYTDIVRTLLDAHADLAAVMPNGESALDFALSGVTDIDRFTWGNCQRDTVRLLRSAAPNLLPKHPAKLKSCG